MKAYTVHTAQENEVPYQVISLMVAGYLVQWEIRNGMITHLCLERKGSSSLLQHSTKRLHRSQNANHLYQM